MSLNMRAATAVALSLSLSLLLQMPSPAVATEAMNAMTYIGCFNSSKPMTNEGSYTYQTSGYCQEVCYNVSMPAMGLNAGAYCYCGEELPAESTKVSDSNCDTPCNGYGTEDCGGDDYWSVYKTGLEADVSYYGGSSSSSASASSSTTAAASSSSTATATTTAAVVTTTESAGKTVVVTYTPTGSSKSTTNDSKSKSSTAGIAAGVVVGVVAAGAIAGGAFFYLRHRRRKQVEEEYSKRSQAQDYSASSGGMAARGMSVRSKNDARLDPSVNTRRLSDGSIADEQDYSRRILTVTNPDDNR